MTPHLTTVESTGRMVVEATKTHVATTGMRFMLSPETARRGIALGCPDGSTFYTIGRGGVLGDVPADVVTAAFGFFTAGWVKQRWDQGRRVLAPREASTHYARACADWGEQNVIATPDLPRWNDAAAALVDGIDPAGLPLFAGWRSQPRPDGGPALAMTLIHLLREWRGGTHLLCTLALGRSMLSAALDDGGEQHAISHGWQPPWPAPPRIGRGATEQLTDDRCAEVVESILGQEQRTTLIQHLPATCPA